MFSLHDLRFRRDHRWTPQHLSEYLDDELPAAQRHRVRRHTDQCPECRGVLHSLRRLVIALRAPRAREPVAERLVDGLRASLGQDDRP